MGLQRRPQVALTVRVLTELLSRAGGSQMFVFIIISICYILLSMLKLQNFKKLQEGKEVDTGTLGSLIHQVGW